MEDIKAKARRIWEEIFPVGDAVGLAEIIHPDGISHSARPGEPQGFEGVKQTMLWLLGVFSEQNWEIHHVIGEDDTVAVHCTMNARHTGNLMGVPPTNRLVSCSYVHILRFEDGMAVEHWSVREDLELMRQLGVIPSPPDALAAGNAGRN